MQYVLSREVNIKAWKLFTMSRTWNFEIIASNALERPTNIEEKMTFTENFSSLNENEKFSSGDYQVSDFKKEKFEEKNLENSRALSEKF